MYRYRVCVADDCPEAADILAEGLRLNNYEAVVAHNGEEALTLCAKGNIDLVLLDVCMPDMDGYEVCRRLKASPKTRDTLVIFVTVKGAKEDVSLGHKVGASDYITKPYNLPMVMLRVDAALRRKRIEDRIRIENEALVDGVYTDHLTGLRTRQFLLERLQEEVEKGHRYDFPVSCAVFDVDEVSAVNRTMGTVSMDDLLVELAIMLRDQARACDILARCDFTEFAAVLPHATLDDAKVFASRILHEVSLTTFCHPTYPTLASLRAGVVTCENGAAHKADHVFREAMCRLLEAKSLAGEPLVARAMTLA